MPSSSSGGLPLAISTATVLTVTPEPQVIKQEVTLSAMVTTFNGQPVNTGTVEFEEGDTVLATGALGPNGSVFVTTTFKTPGTHEITAVYEGASLISATVAPTQFLPSSSAAVNELVVTPKPPNLPDSNASMPSVSVAFGPAGEVTEVVGRDGVLTQFDATSTRILATNVRSASVAFTPGGQEIMVVVYGDGSLYQFDQFGSRLLGAGVLSASVAVNPTGGEVLEVVQEDGTLIQFDATSARVLAAGVRSTSVAFGPQGEVLLVLFQNGTLVRFDATGSHPLGSGVLSAGIAVNPAGGEVLDVIFTNGDLVQFDSFGAHDLGKV